MMENANNRRQRQNVYTNMPVIDHLWKVVFRDMDITAGLSDSKVPVLLALGELFRQQFTFGLLFTAYSNSSTRGGAVTSVLL